MLAAIRLRHRLTTLDVVTRGTTWVVRGTVNPTGELPTQAQADGSREKPYTIE